MKRTLMNFLFAPLLFVPFLTFGNDNASFDLSKVKALVILECEKQSAQPLLDCLEESGAGLIAREGLKRYNDDSVEPLCLKSSSGSIVNHLKCLSSQLEIKESSDFAQYSSLILRVNEFRSSWVSLCRNTNGHLVSDCVKSKTSEFYQMWNIYINLGMDKAKGARFEYCMSSQKDLDWSVFLGCYYR